jgi:hypothetical protein
MFGILHNAGNEVVVITAKPGTHCKYASVRPLVPLYGLKESSTFIIWTSLAGHCIYHISPQGRVTPVVGLLANPRRFGNPVPFTLRLELLFVLYVHTSVRSSSPYQMGI